MSGSLFHVTSAYGGYFGVLAAAAPCDKVRLMEHQKKTLKTQEVLTDKEASHYNQAFQQDFDKSILEFARRRHAGITGIGTAFAKYIHMCGIKDGRSNHEN